MRDRLREYDVDRWASDFISELKEIKEIQVKDGFRKMDDKVIKDFMVDYSRSRKKLIMLDYDGTLSKFRKLPGEAVPDEDLMEDLYSLIEMDGNEVIIVSGRDRGTLNEWFGHLPINIVAEHGVWIREKGDQWRMMEQLEGSWKEMIRPVLDSYVIKTPGSFIEEKSYSLAWHYRRSDQNQANAQISEMKETLHNMISNLDVGILNGNKVIEIKNININKGRAIRRWLDSSEWDFMMAIGDDWTDEDMFSELPEKGYSIRVGYRSSKARYNLKNVDEARELIHKMASK
jgi:trehalose 6-phosphate synthase/phosphatase